MISIRNSVTDLEKCCRERDTAVSCYLAAIRNLAQYTLELSPITEEQRKHLAVLADEVTSGTPEVLEESRSTLRSLLRDYHDKAAQYLEELREELAGSTRALEEILDSLSQADGDHEARLRGALIRLREVAAAAKGTPLGNIVAAAGNAIEESIEQINKQHHLTVSQLQVELRILHKRIDSMESAVALDTTTQVFNRAEIEEQIRSAPAGCCLLLLHTTGFRLAHVQFREEVATELICAFTKRLRNRVPPGTVIGRWSHEEFAAIVNLPKEEVTAIAKWVSENLSGSYACLLAGKTVRPPLQVTVAVVELTDSAPERRIERVKGFLNAA